MIYILASLLGYLIGSIPFALVIGKVFYGVDVRKHGSGNLGGTNTGRTLGAKAGAAVAILDVLKATLAMTLVYFLFDHDTNSLLAAGFFATLGHCFPVFAGFKGGKAVSTAVGFLLGIAIFLSHNPWHFIAPVLLFFLVLYLTKIVSLSSIITVTFASVLLLLTQDHSLTTLAFTIVALIVVWRHRKNIENIKKGTERKITWM